MTMRRAALPTIARALREQGATVDECIERFGVPDLRAELSELERLIEARQLVPAANAGARKEALLRSEGRFLAPAGCATEGRDCGGRGSCCGRHSGRCGR
jgi:hypothetical protein